MAAPGVEKSSPRRRRPCGCDLFSSLLSPKFHLALLFVSSFSAKLLHLYSHRASIPILLYLLYTPTFIFLDVVHVVFAWLLLSRNSRGGLCAPRRIAGGLYAALTATAAAAEISFFLETGGGIKWLAAGSVGSSWAGVKLMLSGMPVLLGGVLIFSIVARILTPWFYDGVDALLGKIGSAYLAVAGVKLQSHRYSLLKTAESDHVEDDRCGDEPQRDRKSRRPLLLALTVTTALVTCIVLLIVRPRTPPYAHMSGSLPFTMIGSILFSPVNTEFCLSRPTSPVNFPYNETFFEVLPKAANGDYPGWAPQSEDCRARESPFAQDAVALLGGGATSNQSSNPESESQQPVLSYDPKCDPLWVSNLDKDVLEPVTDALKSEKPVIRHVMLITMESTRKDVFPLKKNSHVYNTILESYKGEVEADDLDAKLARLVDVSTILTGETDESSLANPGQSQTASAGWRSRFNDTFGGINILNAMTGSAFTLKSLIGSHCGVEPLAVDYTEEAHAHFYQSCIPRIMDLLNKKTASKEDEESSSDFRSASWESVLVQSITDKYDSQDIVDEHMGFDRVIHRETLRDPKSTYYPPKQEECNYFGYPETETLPYLRDILLDATKNNKRLFMSHVTSTTHHPYTPPKDWEGHESYLADGRWGSEDTFNKYLNTIKYQDEWLGTVFNLLEETNVLNETLVVLVGDHGLAFPTPDGSSSTYENGHISNFNVPLLFVHPSLPRLQLTAKTTSISIIPTILDLLIQTHSLNAPSTAAASKLLHRYQGQSLIRPFVPAKPGGRQPWYFGIINPGGSMLAVSSAATSFRLVLPLCSTAALRFTDLRSDPDEQRPIVEWTVSKLEARVRERFGEQEVEWVRAAQKLARWWFWEQRVRWRYFDLTRSTERRPDNAGGGTKKEHWWET